MQPEPVTAALFAEAKEKLREKKNPVMLDKARFKAFDEGLSIQIMHLGPFSEEPATIAKLVDFAAENGYTTHDKHHEIYLSDPRRTSPAKLRTVLRHPVKKIRTKSAAFALFVLILLSFRVVLGSLHLIAEPGKRGILVTSSSE